MKFKVARRTEECKNCGFCDLICTHQDACIGCGACVVACPYEATILEEISERRKELKPSCVTPVEEGMAIITDREERERRESQRGWFPVFKGMQ